MDQPDLVLRRKNVRYQHETTVYVPVFQKDYDDEGNLLFSPTFSYSMSDATQDPQMAWAMKPDYVLELRGTFDATTKDLDLSKEPE